MLTDDTALAFSLGLTALPKATHPGTYSWRVRRESNHTLLTAAAVGLAGVLSGCAASLSGARRR
jgi:hypothetical protein